LYDLNCHVWPVVKIATTRAQYGGLKLVVLSTRMKRRSWLEMDFILRFRCSRLLDVVSAVLGGMKMPSPRKDLMLDMRRSEDAEGESRMMGSRRRVGFFCRFETSGDGCGWAGTGALGRERRNVAASLR